MPSAVSVVTLYCALSLILHTAHTDAKDACLTCKEITDNFNKGFDRTAKQNFGGGNTAWEERKLSKYETSEIRLVEILEGLCESSNFECNHMVEEHEEEFETWWFKKKKKHPDLFKWFCINTIEVCCPKGTFGPDCNACVGGSERPCHGNGVCKGDGTREGDGRCSCNHGYQGEFCLDCVDGHHNVFRNDTFSVCAECHASCKTCTGATNRDCGDCKPGWEKNEEGACNDVDECSLESPPCEEDRYCLNTDGSYSCQACDKACSGCKGAGPSDCLACAEGYREDEGTCADIDECEQPDEVCPGEHRECVNLKGSYKCICSSKFEERDGVCVQTEEPEETPEVPDQEPTEATQPKHLEEHEDL